MTKRYPSVGKCIYCGITGVPLTDEHIAPAGLNGDLLLPKASCNNCQKITAKVENYCLRSMLGRARITLGMRTRRPKERPKTLPIFKVDKTTGIRTQIDVPVEKSPPFMVLPVPPIARVLRGLPWDDGPVNMQAWVWPPPGCEKLINEIEALGGSTVYAEMDPGLFLRMIAKIGHAYACAERGVDSFQPVATPFILGRDNSLNSYVGAGYFDEKGFLHEGYQPAIEEVWRLQWHMNDMGYIVVSVRFLAHYGSPTYHVAVGRDRKHMFSQYGYGRSRLVLTRI